MHKQRPRSLSNEPVSSQSSKNDRSTLWSLRMYPSSTRQLNDMKCGIIQQQKNKQTNNRDKNKQLDTHRRACGGARDDSRAAPPARPDTRRSATARSSPDFVCRSSTLFGSLLWLLLLFRLMMLLITFASTALAFLRHRYHCRTADYASRSKRSYSNRQQSKSIKRANSHHTSSCEIELATFSQR